MIFIMAGDPREAVQVAAARGLARSDWHLYSWEKIMSADEPEVWITRCARLETGSPELSAVAEQLESRRARLVGVECPYVDH